MKKSLFKLFFVFLFLLTSVIFINSCEEQCDHLYFNETLIPPTCEENGKTVHKCTDCDFEFYSDVVTATGHTLNSTVFAPTCEYEGYTYYFCDCGYSYKSDFTEALGHTGEETVVPPTCTDEGYTLVACVNCKEDHKKELIPPIDHKFESVDIAATCTEAGYTLHTCLECNFSYQDKLTDPTGHTFNSRNIGATLTHDGYTLHNCACGHSYESDHHSYSKIFTTSYCESSTPIMKGLDISKSNHATGANSSDIKPLDWNALRSAGFDFVILKIGSTKSGKEATFEDDYIAAKEAGFKVGVYFYTYAKTVEETQADADRVIEWLQGKQLELPVFYDIEDPSLEELEKELLTDMCIAFIERMQENFFYAALYCNNPWLNERLDNTRLLDKIDIWYARWWYGSDTEILPEDTQFVWQEKYGKQLSMWQYASSGVIDGFKQSTASNAKNTHFDFNYCYKDFETVIKANHLNGY